MKSREGNGNSLEKKDHLSESDKKMVEKLKAREKEVVTHEQAHVAAGASSPSYTYTMGPDNRRYITGGHAQIDVGEESTPEKTISKMRTVIRAALAPSKPSSTDRNVAAKAQRLLEKAQQELNKEKSEKKENTQEDLKISEKSIDGLSGHNRSQSMDSFYKGNFFDRVG